MLPKPRYLDLQDELYYPITLHKELIFDNPEDHFHMELFERLAYDSYNRLIDLTHPVAQVLAKAYGHHQEYHLYVHDPCIGDFRFLAYYPHQHPITLGEQFLQADTLLFQVRSTPLPLSSSDDEEQLHITTLDSYDPHEQEEPTAAAGDKSRRRKTIKEMLQVVKQWRKLYLQSDSKLSTSEGAELIGTSKRTLEFYLQSVKLAEKHQYPFESSMQKKISDLKKFLKQKSVLKKNQEMQMLEKFKHFYK